jgi:hypothetical protein
MPSISQRVRISLATVFGPVLQRVEGDDAYGIVELPRQEISDDGFDVRSLNLDFTVDAAFRSKAIDYEVDRLICPVRHYTQRQASSWHAHLQSDGTENQARDSAILIVCRPRHRIGLRPRPSVIT